MKRKKHLTACLIALALTAGCGSSSGSSSSINETTTASTESSSTITAAETETAMTTGSETTTETSAEASSTATGSSSAATETAPPTTEEITEAADFPALTEDLFSSELNGVQTVINDDSVFQRGTINETDFYLTIDLSGWEGNTSPQQIAALSKLFWQCYPKMYQRFHDISNPPTYVILAIENHGYEIAEAGGDRVHLHDMWLCNNPEDYDCITHELAHIIQGSGWSEYYLENDYYIELFADLCRYEYALDSGIYNDDHWELSPASPLDSRTDSIRFFIWLDYTYSTSENDLIRSFLRLCHDELYPADEWELAWNEILKDTPMSGHSVEEVWTEFLCTDFSQLSTYAESGETSELLAEYPVREKADELSYSR